MTVAMNVSIRGYVVGPIWWPAGAECFKEFTYDVTREDARFTEPGTLRDHVLAITNNGDFQHCSLAQAELVVTTFKPGRKRSRSWPLERFPSIKDCLHEDADWQPFYCDEDDE